MVALAYQWQEWSSTALLLLNICCITATQTLTGGAIYDFPSSWPLQASNKSFHLGGLMRESSIMLRLMLIRGQMRLSMTTFVHNRPTRVLAYRPSGPGGETK